MPICQDCYIKSSSTSENKAEKPKVNWWWPTISDRASAEEAVKVGFWAAMFVAGVTAIVATIALVSGEAVMSIKASAYLDAVLFLIIGWRIRNHSRVFSVLGLLLFIAEKAMLAKTQGSTGWFMAIFILLGFITGARGAFAYHRYKQKDPLPANA
jgi:hypothetical protein